LLKFLLETDFFILDERPAAKMIKESLIII
jgi:hypothetical protein